LPIFLFAIFLNIEKSSNLAKKNSWQKVNNFFNNHTPNVLNVLVKKYEYKVVELLGKKKNQIINIIHPGMMYKNYETFIYELVPPVLKKKKKRF